MADMLGILLDNIDDSESCDNCSNLITTEGMRLTFVLSPINNNKKIVGLLSAIINYSDRTTPNILKGIDALYVELGCSSDQFKDHSTGTNYFIRAFVLLEAFRYKSVRNLWGSASGEIGGDNKALQDIHIKRKCVFFEETKIYYCDPIEFLNEFFRRLHDNSLLLYSKSF